MRKKYDSTKIDDGYKAKIVDGAHSPQNKLLVGTPTLGNIRMEWAVARYGQVIPSNWSKTDMTQYLSGYIPIRYQVADAQNLIVQEAVTRGFEWLLLIEDDTIPPPDAFIRFGEYIRKGDYPIVSGLYFTRSDPPEPMTYRGRGTSYYKEWKLGDKVWVDGVPTGMLLISVKLLKKMWDDAAPYQVPNAGIAKRVFTTPVNTYFNEETGAQEVLVGTSDLDWCTQVIEGGYLEDWPKVRNKQYPLLVDTNIFCKHIDRNDGQIFPIQIPKEFLK